MRILHTSDWHLGQNFMGQSRAKEHTAFLAWLLDTIKKEKIDTLIVAGDIFDTGTPPNYALELYYNFLKELSSIKTLLYTIIVAGNHDSVATLKTSQELLKALNIYVITTGEKLEDTIIPIKKDNNLQAIVCAVPFLRDSVIRKVVEKESSSQKEKALKDAIKLYYEDIHKKALELKGDKDIPLIATGHLTTTGIDTKDNDSERDIHYIGGVANIDGNYLGELFDYVALGHIHKNYKVDVDHVRYSGSPLPLSFSEANQIKKVNIVSFEDKKLTIEKKDIPLYRKLLVLSGDSKTIQESLKEIEDKSVWIEIHLKDDNPMFENQVIRELANSLELVILAIKVVQDTKELSKKVQNVISLEELNIDDVFQKRLEDANIEDKKLKDDLNEAFKIVLQEV